MAAAARQAQYPYRRPATYGDLAYDLDREVRERELRHAGELRRQAVAEPQVRSIAKVQVRQRQKVSPAAVLGFLAVAAMAVVVLMGMVHLTEISSDVTELRSQLETLKTENVALTAQYQKMYDLNTVRAAAEQAGMSKPGGSQIYYIDLSEGDSAVVYQKDQPGILSRLLTSVGHGFYAVVEYFD